LILIDIPSFIKRLPIQDPLRNFVRRSTTLDATIFSFDLCCPRYGLPMFHKRVLPKPAALCCEVGQIMPHGPACGAVFDHKAVKGDIREGNYSGITPLPSYSGEFKSVGVSSCRHVPGSWSNQPPQPHHQSLSESDVERIPSNKGTLIRGETSSSSATGLSLVEEKKNSDHFCQCQLDLKIPRPRNGESTQSASLSVVLAFLF
jgi:hypothetical protein